MRILFTALFVTLLGAGISACSFVGFPGVYKIDVEQGNIVTQEMADQLRPGMSKRQVRFILGTPLVEDTFNPNRWDYPYVKRNGNNIISQSSITVEFEGETLLQVSGDYLPPAWQAPGDESAVTAEESDDVESGEEVSPDAD